jgi:hypothetical protein
MPISLACLSTLEARQVCKGSRGNVNRFKPYPIIFKLPQVGVVNTITTTVELQVFHTSSNDWQNVFGAIKSMLFLPQKYMAMFIDIFTQLSIPIRMKF